jgi:hypothetical protein
VTFVPKDGNGDNIDVTKKAVMVTFIVLLLLGLTAARKIGATTVNVDCNKGGAVGRS